MVNSLMDWSAIMEQNPNKEADRFLELIRRSRQGHFKLYIGMSAGVGKTYRMLTDTHRLLAQGIDIVIGYIETHGRVEVDELVQGLPVIPRKKIFYKGHELEEMDIDAVLRRHPEVVVVDELPHTNAPGSRNEKRYQDVMEILDAGINVISALNVQHIESLNSIIQRITSIEVVERVPDDVLRRADEVVTVDLTVDELLERLKQGKIYQPEKVDTALGNFFQKDNLLHLRELVLREVANLVERKIEYESPEKKKGSERLLACVSTNNESAKKIIRKCARSAERLDAPWYALYVQTPREAPDRINLSMQRHLINNLKMATELGAEEVVKVEATDVAEAILAFAREKGITHILYGRSQKSLLKKLLTGDIAGALMSGSGELGIDLQIVA